MKRKVKMKRKKKGSIAAIENSDVSEFGSAAWQKYFIAFRSEIVIGKELPEIARNFGSEIKFGTDIADGSKRAFRYASVGNQWNGAVGTREG